MSDVWIDLDIVAVFSSGFAFLQSLCAPVSFPIPMVRDLCLRAQTVKDAAQVYRSRACPLWRLRHLESSSRRIWMLGSRPATHNVLSLVPSLPSQAPAWALKGSLGGTSPLYMWYLMDLSSLIR